MKKFSPKKTIPLAAIGVAGLAYAATVMSVIQLNDEIYLSPGGSGHKPKIQRAGADGTLVSAFGDSPADAPIVYDTKAQAERKARDIFVRWCKPTPEADTTTVPRITCDAESEWSTPLNVSRSVARSSIQTNWRGDGNPLPFPGDIDKPNIKTSGPVMVLTWTSKFCPNGDLTQADADGDQNLNQRAIRYLDRASRVIPFSCTWMAYGRNNGTIWSDPIQLSNGERDAKQDASAGTYLAPNARINISWQEDPEGLQPGDADGPGDGASGANVTGGTDVWYTHATINNATGVITFGPGENSARTARTRAYRVTDNWDGTTYGLSGQISNVFDALGNNLDGRSDGQRVEQGRAGASRPNIGMVGTNTVLAWEETKGSQGLSFGKFVRYLNFAYNTPPAATPGCILSNPVKNARRVRFLTQDEAAAPVGGVNIAIFFKEGFFDQGGPSDIVVRRGMGGLASTNMVPAVDPGCATSVYEEAVALANVQAENISSRASAVTATDTGLTDDTELNFAENALAHRGVLRGNELWIGYNYTGDLVKLWAQIDNYNFWVRKFTWDEAAATGSWGLPQNITNITDKRINVREPRFFGTPPSQPAGCPGGDPTTAPDPSLCQAKNVIFVAYGSQANVSPFDPSGGDDLGIYLTVSRDAGATFIPAVEYSTERGSLFDDEDYAFEAQLVARPDGRRVYGMFNTENAGGSAAAFRSGNVLDPADLSLTASSLAVTATAPATVTFTVSNAGPAEATAVILSATVPAGLTVSPVPTGCSVTGATLRCVVGGLRAGQSQSLPVTIASAGAIGTFTVDASVSSAVVDANATNNSVAVPTQYTAPPVAAAEPGSSSGGCTISDGRSPFDPTLPLLCGLGLAGLGLRRLNRG